MAVHKLFSAFELKPEGLLKSMTDNISDEVDYSLITHESTPADLVIVKDKIVKKLWKWPSIQVFDDTDIKDYKPVELSHYDAGTVLSSYSFSNTSSTVSMVLITYGLRYIGNEKALKYSVNYPKRVLNIDFNTNNIIMFYYYGQGKLEDCAQSAKAEKANLVSLINSNQSEVDVFFQSKKPYFELLVTSAVQVSYENAVNKNRGLNLL